MGANVEFQVQEMRQELGILKEEASSGLSSLKQGTAQVTEICSRLAEKVRSQVDRGEELARQQKET